MTLDTYKLHKLEEKGFHTLYAEHKEKWDKMVKKAAKKNQDVRRGK